MKKVLIASGKGGVGKTTITVAIAKMLAKSGFRVGILDIDIDTPNIPEFTSIEDRDLDLSENGIIPKLTEDGIEIMSVGFMADTSLAIMWNGERRSMAIDQMINNVDWTCDVLVIDSPPGTTEELMTVISKFSPDAIVIVSTNHKASVADVKRTLAMIKILKAENKVVGIVKNMVSILCAKCNEKILLFDGDSDEEIDKMTIAEIPWIKDGENIDGYLENAVTIISDRL